MVTDILTAAVFDSEKAGCGFSDLFFLFFPFSLTMRARIEYDYHMRNLLLSGPDCFRRPGDGTPQDALDQCAGK